MIGPETDIVIEGYPGSANSWTNRVFRHWQKGKVRIAHHIHSEAQIVEGCRLGLPVIALIRDPKDAVRCFCKKDKRADPNWALRRWIAFYDAVEKCGDDVVIATFPQATSDLGSVVQRVNARFGTQFAYGDIDETLFQGITAHMASGAWPDPSRKQRERPDMLELEADKLDIAQKLYDRFAERA